MVRLQRVYDEARRPGGLRILVDRLWPRGLTKEADPVKWPEFLRQYGKELEQQPDSVARLRALVGKHEVTLLYSSKEERLNNAVALVKLLGL
jgi:uncharacterized protein YeaO (DUF488 family)